MSLISWLMLSGIPPLASRLASLQYNRILTIFPLLQVILAKHVQFGHQGADWHQFLFQVFRKQPKPSQPLYTVTPFSFPCKNRFACVPVDQHCKKITVFFICDLSWCCSTQDVMGAKFADILSDIVGAVEDVTLMKNKLKALAPMHLRVS